MSAFLTASPPFNAAPPVQVVLLTTYNTLAIAPGQVYQLVTSASPGAGPFYYNVLNLGAGYVYFSDSETPVAGTQNTMGLPSGLAYNGMFIGEGTRGVFVIGDASGATLSLCLVQQTTGPW